MLLGFVLDSSDRDLSDADLDFLGTDISRKNFVGPQDVLKTWRHGCFPDVSTKTIFCLPRPFPDVLV